MFLFKIFQLKKTLREVRENPSAFAGGQMREFLWGVFILPLLIVGGILILFFIMGYTDVFGFHYGIFKILFWITIVVAGIFLLMLRLSIRLLGKKTVGYTEKTISYSKTLKNTYGKDTN